MMEKNGFLLDVEYTESLSAELKYQESINNEIALKYGCESVNSTEQVADVLESYGCGHQRAGRLQVSGGWTTTCWLNSYRGAAAAHGRADVRSRCHRS